MSVVPAAPSAVSSFAPGLDPDQVAAATASAADAARLLAAVDVRVPRVKAPPAYGAVIVALAACLVLLSLAYAALAAFMGWLVAWHVIQSVVSFQYGPYFVFHLPMAVLGGLLLLFLVKPIFFRLKAGPDDGVTLTAKDQPLLFAFVTKLCKSIGSPVPDRIEVDCDPNASARLRSGLSAVLGKKLVLRVGLPLAAAMTVRQFAGVLGHEFGHFNQRGGLAGSYFIRRLNGFFARIVFQRDRLDERLERLRRSPNALAQLSYWPAVVLVEPMRGVLWLMLLVGELLTCTAMRRMEYDADHVEAQVAGVADFALTSRRLVFLSIAARRARQDLADALDRKQLADDLPALIAANALQLEEHRDDILKLVEGERTKWLDTHPSHGDRVANVERSGAAGLVECDAPASSLFADFGGVCRSATDAFYRAAMGDEAYAEAKASTKTVATSELAGDRAVERRAGKALHRFFRGRVLMNRPVFPYAEAAPVDAEIDLDAPPPPEPVPVDERDLDAVVAELAAAREQALAAAAGLGPAVDGYREAVEVLPFARAQCDLCNVFAGANPKVHQVRQRAMKLQRTHEPAIASATPLVEAFEVPARRRLYLGLELLRRDDVAARVAADVGPDVDFRGTVADLFGLCGPLQAAHPSIERLRWLATSLQVYMAAYDDENPYQPLVRQILQTNAEIVETLRAARQELGEWAYPFAHGTDNVSVGQAVVPKEPAADNPAEAHGFATAAVDQYYTLLFRTLSTLTEWAERAEAAVGLEPLPEPKDDDDAEQTPKAAEERKAADKASRRYWLGYGGRAAAGLLLVCGLIVWSVNPPTLPTMPWEPPGASQARGRPSAFRAAEAPTRYTYYTPTPPRDYNPMVNSPAGVPQPWRPTFPGRQPSYPGQPNYPGQPGYPNQPGYQRQPAYPGQPGYQPNQPGRYNPQQPGRYTPPGSPSPGGGGRPSPGGGGGSPVGGGGRR